MTDREAFRRFNTIAQKWRDLAEKRRAHYAELYRTGRWKHYYSEVDFVLRMRDVIGAADNWAKIAPRPGDDAGAPAQPAPPAPPRAKPAEPVELPPRRTAA